MILSVFGIYANQFLVGQACFRPQSFESETFCIGFKSDLQFPVWTGSGLYPIFICKPIFLRGSHRIRSQVLRQIGSEHQQLPLYLSGTWNLFLYYFRARSFSLRYLGHRTFLLLLLGPWTFFLLLLGRWTAFSRLRTRQRLWKWLGRVWGSSSSTCGISCSLPGKTECFKLIFLAVF